MSVSRSLVFGFFVVACASPPEADAPRAIAVDAMLEDLRYLSSDDLNGRQAGTEGNAAARAYIVGRMSEAGVSSFPGGLEMPFAGGTNVVGLVPGREDTTSVIVLTAHFDHLGACNGDICNGADDNASGTAAVLAIAEYLVRHPLRHTIIVAALDAEEGGLLGARAFVDSPPVARERIRLNVNLDMISHSDSTLFAAGTYHYPVLGQILQPVVDRADIDLRFGHDRPELGSGDWTSASDHGPFHAAGIPFVYFGVEDHPDYHQPSDEFDTINQTFYAQAVETILQALQTLDARLDEVQP